MMMAFYSLLVGALLCSSKDATDDAHTISLGFTGHVSKMSSGVTESASKADELLLTDSIASSVEEPAVYSTLSRENSPTLTTEEVTFSSEYPETTRKATIDTPQNSTDAPDNTSADAVTFSSGYPVTTSRATIPTTNINTGTSGKTRVTDCRLPGVLYQGSRNITESGRSCQRWQAQTPHAHNYDVFSLAQENYCRNFDREEPWCFTNDSNVRWELCGVDVCDSPCFDQSYYRYDTKAYRCLLFARNKAEYCKYTLDLVECLKNNVERSSGVQCPQIPLKAIARQLRSTMEMMTSNSISECIRSACADPILATFFGFDDYMFSCDFAIAVEESTPDTLCRNVQRVSHCAISLVNDESNTTCVTQDKIYLVKTFVSRIYPEVSTNISICISDFLSEFPQPVENTTVLVVTTVTDKSATMSSDLTVLILSVVFVLVLIAVISIGIGLYKMRTNILRKRARRLPSIPKRGEHLYESTLHNPEELNYTDPDYQTVEEMNEGYEHLMGIKNDIEDDRGINGDNRGSYVQPNDVHFEAEIADEDENDKYHSYLELLEYPEKPSCTISECNKLSELPSEKCDNETTTQQERKNAPELHRKESDMNQQETATIPDSNSSEQCNVHTQVETK